MTIKPYWKRWNIAMMLCALTAHQAAAASPAANVIESNPPVREVKLSFADLGVDSIALHGVQSSAAVNVGTRKDEVVVAAVLHLRLTYSPSLLPDLSHLRVSLNGETLAALPLTKADAGHEIERDVVLDPRYFSDYNRIQLDLIGHYSLECEDPQHSALWASVSRQSDLTLTLRPIELRDDLGLLPAPFFDVHDSRRVVLPILLPAHATREMVRSAGAVASWFGMLADYRGARFPVSFDSLPEQHGLVFATNASRFAQLTLPEVQAPTVSIIDHPARPTVKLLVFQGKDEAQLRQAVEGVILGSAVLSGSTANISKVMYTPRRAYDAPRWLSTDRPVRLGELIEAPDQLQAHGVAPAPMSINLRLPPDLFTWNHPGVPVDLHYRYTAPAERDNSLLTVSINNQLLRSYRLPPSPTAVRAASSSCRYCRTTGHARAAACSYRPFSWLATTRCNFNSPWTSIGKRCARKCSSITRARPSIPIRPSIYPVSRITPRCRISRCLPMRDSRSRVSPTSARRRSYCPMPRIGPHSSSSFSCWAAWVGKPARPPSPTG